MTGRLSTLLSQLSTSATGRTAAGHKRGLREVTSSARTGIFASSTRLGDCVKYTYEDRYTPPFKGKWALPGGFLKSDETLEDSSTRPDR